MKTYNIVYFIGAIDRPMLWFNLWYVKKNLHRFNGKKVMTIAKMLPDAHSLTHANLTTPDEIDRTVTRSDELVAKIIKFFDDPSIEFYMIDNHPNGETPSFVGGISSLIANTNPDEATFYGHTKGIRYPGLRPEMGLWTGTMYNTCFDNFADVETKLWTDGYVSYGALKRVAPVFLWTPSGPIAWHYSGGVYWFRHDPFFSRNWECNDQNAGVMEYIIPRVVSDAEGYSPLYVPSFMHDTVEFYKEETWSKWLAMQGSTVEQRMVELGFDITPNGFSFTKHLE